MKRLGLNLMFLAALVIAANSFGPAHAQPGAAAQDDAAKKFDVKVDNFNFSPTALSVPVGATVTWTNQDDVPHNVRSSEGDTLKSPVLDTGEKFSFTFTKAGTYPYYCAIHPKMTGKVVVQ